MAKYRCIKCGTTRFDLKKCERCNSYLAKFEFTPEGEKNAKYKCNKCGKYSVYPDKCCWCDGKIVMIDGAKSDYVCVECHAYKPTINGYCQACQTDTKGEKTKAAERTDTILGFIGLSFLIGLLVLIPAACCSGDAKKNTTYQLHNKDGSTNWEFLTDMWNWQEKQKK